MPDEKPEAAPAKAPAEMTVRAFAAEKQIKPGLAAALASRCGGLDKPKPLAELNKLLAALKKERI